MPRILIFTLLLFTLFVSACTDDEGTPVSDGDSDNAGDGDTADGDSADPGCTAGTYVCQGNDVYHCNDDGEWAYFLNCAEQGDFVCNNGLCVEAGSPDGDVPDGDWPDGDWPDGDWPDGDWPDGDWPDGDWPDGDDPSCSGTCDPYGDLVIFCTPEGWLCSCENGSWVSYDCDLVCAAEDKVATGCGYHPSYETDWCYCEPTDGDWPDGDWPDGDDPDCYGRCDPDTSLPECIHNIELCSCDPDTAMKVVLDCNDICRENGYSGAESCEFNDSAGYDVCYCYDIECQSDHDCIEAGTGDYCVSMGENTFCTPRCDLAQCGGGVGCIDLGIGEGCGACVDIPADAACDTVGESCSTSGICHDICGLYDAICSDACEAIPSSCANAGELCWPLGDGQGNIIDGICINYGANCPDCDKPDGDMDEDLIGN